MRRMGRKHGQESVITKDKDKPAKLHYTEKGSKAKSDSIGKSKAGKHPEGYGETSGTKVRGGKLPKKTNKSSYHYGEERRKCKYCGITAPLGHQRPTTWMEKHELNCARNPKNKEE